MHRPQIACQHAARERAESINHNVSIDAQQSVPGLTSSKMLGCEI
jgi:hypothetical protein